MKKFMIASMGLALMMLFLSPAVQAQRGRRGQNAQAYARTYNPQTVETTSGTVLNVAKVKSPGRSYGIHLSVQTAAETIEVHLGPAWYIENQEQQISTGDQIEITGSRITFEGKPALIAAEVHRGPDVFVLRNELGIPAWSGWRRANRRAQPVPN